MRLFRKVVDAFRPPQPTKTEQYRAGLKEAEEMVTDLDSSMRSLRTQIEDWSVSAATVKTFQELQVAVAGMSYYDKETA
jgi:exonuclease VII small subunit